MRLQLKIIFTISIIIAIGCIWIIIAYHQFKSNYRLYVELSEPNGMIGRWQTDNKSINNTNKEYDKQYLVLNDDYSCEFHFQGYPYIMSPFYDRLSSHLEKMQSPIKGTWETRSDEEGTRYIDFRFVFFEENYSIGYIICFDRVRKCVLINIGLRDNYYEGDIPIRLYKNGCNSQKWVAPMPPDH